MNTPPRRRTLGELLDLGIPREDALEIAHRGESPVVTDGVRRAFESTADFRDAQAASAMRDAPGAKRSRLMILAMKNAPAVALLINRF